MEKIKLDSFNIITIAIIIIGLFFIGHYSLNRQHADRCAINFDAVYCK